MQTIEVKDCFSHPQVGWLTVNQAPTIYRLLMTEGKRQIIQQLLQEYDIVLGPG